MLTGEVIPQCHEHTEAFDVSEAVLMTSSMKIRARISNRTSADRGYKEKSESSYIHAKNKIVARFIPFSVLGFWVKSTGICAGAFITGILRPLPGFRHLTQKKA